MLLHSFTSAPARWRTQYHLFSCNTETSFLGDVSESDTSL